MNAVLKYPGSKWRLADTIISRMPKHETYLEPFLGSGAVFFKKEAARQETINDVDNNVVNLFRVIRENANDLARLVELTPYSRQEYINSLEDSVEPIEMARKFLVRTWMGFGGKTNKPASWAHSRYGEVFRPKYWSRVPDRILAIVERLKQAQIENMDALKLMELYNNKGTLVYLDPPYLQRTRKNKHYAHEMSDEDHIELLNLAKKHKGYVIVSAYANHLYDTQLEGWTKETFKIATNAGGTAVETIYYSPNIMLQTRLF